MLKMKEKIIRLNKFVHNVCGSCFFLATGFLCLLAVFIAASHFGFFEPSSTWVPSESSYKKQTTRNYSTSSKKALVARYTEREICKHDPYKKVAEMRSSDSLALDPNGELQGSLMARGASLSLL